MAANAMPVTSRNLVACRSRPRTHGPTCVSMDQPRPPRRATDRESLIDLATAVGRVEAIVSGSAQTIQRVENKIDDHEKRIVNLEADRTARDRAASAAREAIADERANEDRWGRYSPRAVILAAMGSSGLLIGGVTYLLSTH